MEGKDVQATATPIVSATYDGQGGGLFKLALWTTFLTVITVGIYRFWAKTRIRQYVWSSAGLQGDRFEYTGTGLEKFLGFLVAIVFLAVYLGTIQMILFFFGLQVFVEPQTQAEALTQVTAIYISFFALVPFIFFAQYRARRYKFARTRWRGIRFGMDSAAWGYAFRAIGHTILTAVTLGILLPRQTFYLEKYMTDRSHFGDSRLHQHGKWTALYPAMKHLFIGAGILIAGIVVGVLLNQAPIMIIGLAVGYLWFIIGAVSYRVGSFSYLMRNKSLGDEIGFDAAPRTSKIVGIVIVGILVVAAVVTVASVLIGSILYAAINSAGSFTGGATLGLGPILLVAVVYLGTILILAPLSLVLITQPILAHFIINTAVKNPDALASVSQRETDQGADAEGFADALDVGGAI